MTGTWRPCHSSPAHNAPIQHARGRQPVFLTLCHMLACTALSSMLSVCRVTPIRPIRTREQWWKICVLSVIFCASVVCGNLSLKYIPISFNQAIGATTPFFTAIFAALLQGKREASLTYMTLLPIVGGVVIASGGEPLFHVLGFAFALTATAGRALKSVVQAILLTDPNEKLDPMSLVFYMASASTALLLPATLLLEPQALAQVHELVAAKPNFLWWLVGNSTLAYAVNLTNFLVTMYTSALTLQVLGNCKGVIAAIVSIMLFRNPVTRNSCLGYAVTVAGVFAYSEAKRRLTAPQAGNAGAKAQPAASADIEASLEPLLAEGRSNFSSRASSPAGMAT